MLRRKFLIVAALLLAGLCFAIGLVAGNRGAYHRRYLEERGVIAPIINNDPIFAGVEVEERSDGGVYLIGWVDTSADLDRLRASVVRAVGEARANEICMNVDIGR